MTLTAELEALLAQIQDEAERNQTRTLLEKHQFLRDGYLRQADYDRKMDTSKAERDREKAEVEKARSDIKKMQIWWDETQPKVARLEADSKTLRDKNKELEDRVKAAAAAHATDGGGSVDQAMVTKLVTDELQGRSYVSKQEVEDLVKTAAKVIADERESAFFKETLPGSLEFVMTVQDLQFKHQKEFGSTFDRHEFHKFSKENGINDPEKAYESFVSKQRTEKREKDLRADIEKDIRSKMGMPGTGVVIEAPAENPVMKVLQPAAAVKTEAVTAPPALASRSDIRSAALAAAAELRQEGKVA